MGRLNEVVLTGIVDEENRKLVRVSANGLTANVPLVETNPLTGGDVLQANGKQYPLAPLDVFPMYKTQRMFANVRAGLSDGTILCVGDSTTVGQYAAGAAGAGFAGNKKRSYPTALGSLIQSAGYDVNMESVTGDGASFFLTSSLPAYDPRVASGASWSSQIAGLNTVGGGSIYNNAGSLGATAAETWTFTPETSFDTVEIHWQRLTGGGTFTVDLGGGVLATCPAGANGYQKTTVTKTAGTGPINLIRTVVGGVYVAGVVASLSTKKCVKVLNGGWAGSTSANWVSGTQAISPLNMLPRYGQDLTIINLGLNDANVGVSYAAAYANYQALITAAKTVGDVLMVVPNWINTVNVDKLEVIKNAIIDVARANEVNVFSIQSRWGSFANSNALGYMYTDTVHPLQLGLQDGAIGIGRFLLNRVNA